MQCIYSYTIFILYLLDKFIYFVAIHAEILQMHLFSIKCKFYCIPTLNAHVFTYIIFTHELIQSSLYCTQVLRTDLYFVYQQNLLPKGMLCNAVACPHLERSGMGTACSRSASAHLYHAGSRLLPCDGAAD